MAVRALDVVRTLESGSCAAFAPNDAHVPAAIGEAAANHGRALVVDFHPSFE